MTRNRTFEALVALMESDPDKVWTRKELADRTGFSDIGVWKSLNNPKSVEVFNKNSSNKYMQPDTYSLKPDYKAYLFNREIEPPEKLLINIADDVTVSEINEGWTQTLNGESPNSLEAWLPVIENINRAFGFIKRNMRSDNGN